MTNLEHTNNLNLGTLKDVKELFLGWGYDPNTIQPLFLIYMRFTKFQLAQNQSIILLWREEIPCLYSEAATNYACILDKVKKKNTENLLISVWLKYLMGKNTNLSKQIKTISALTQNGRLSTHIHSLCCWQF